MTRCLPQIARRCSRGAKVEVQVGKYWEVREENVLCRG